ncbi:MAG: NAD-dependent epimerase/dehydratase family protein [bacterium]
MLGRKTIDKKNILVFGGAGFIGSHLCQALLREGNVVCVDNFITGKEKNIDSLLRNYNFEFVRHDVTKPIDFLESLVELDKFKVKVQGFQEIYHLACPSLPRRFSELAIEILMANALGTKNILDAVLKYQAKFIFVSSSVVYGKAPDSQPHIDENYMGVSDPLRGRSCYFEGKRFAESLINNYRMKFQLDTKIVRVFTTYGPRMRFSDGRTVSTFVWHALEGKDLVIYGNQNLKSSYCYVDDIIQGLLKLAKSKESGPINLGNDVEVKIIDVAEKVIKMLNSRSKIVFKEPETYYIFSPIPDITLARERLGWSPVYLLDAGLKKTVDYLKASRSLVGFSDSE